MNFASVIRILCFAGLTIAVAMLVPLALSLVFQEHPQSIAFGLTAIFLALISGSIVLLVDKPARRASATDGLAVAIFSWVIVGLVSAPPFVIGVANSSIFAAIHESVSCLTTTGHSVVEIGEGGWPVSLVAWRGLLHIIGAVMTLTIAASVFAAINLGGPGIHRTELFTIPEGSFFDAVPRVLNAVTILVFSMIAICVILLVSVGVSGGQAIVDATSAITTGLVDPLNQPQNVSWARNVIVGTALIFGALGLYVVLQFSRLQFIDGLYDPEVFAFVIACIGFVCIAMFAGLNLGSSVGWSISSLSTSGMIVGEEINGTSLPLSLMIVPALIGGSALSTAGGFKLGRLVILVRRAAQEFGSLGFQGSILKFRYRRRALEESSVISVWVYLIGYISAIVGFLFVFTLLGASFDEAISTSIGSLTNSGALIGAEQQSGVMHAMMILAMLLGRLEILAILPAFVPAFWRK